MSSRFFENQRNEICSHLSEKASKGRFFGFDKLQNHSVTKKKERRKRKTARRKKGGEEKEAMVALLLFIMAIFRVVFGRKKKPLDGKVWR